MATNYLEGLLGEHEQIVLQTRQHWFVLFNKIFLEIVLILIIIGATLFAYGLLASSLALLGFILVLVPIVGLVRDVMIWQNNAFIVTNRRVIQIAGVFSKEVVDSSLEKVNDVKLSQSFFGRMFDFGDVEILTASELGVNLFHEIAKPVEFKTAMLNAKEKLGFEEIGAVAHAVEDIPAMIEKLDSLRKRGILSEAEFQQKKAQLLAKM